MRSLAEGAASYEEGDRVAVLRMHGLTGELQIIPATVVALRAGAGARDPADVIGPVLLASACSVVFRLVETIHRNGTSAVAQMISSAA